MSRSPRTLVSAARGPARPPGLVNGLGGDPHRGLVNGTPPGGGHGLVNGLGRVNGVHAPDGLTNGVPRPPLPRNVVGVVAQKDLRWGLSLLLLSLLLLGPAYLFLAGLETGPTLTIQIDGAFEDWAGVPRYGEVTATVDPHIQLREYAVLLERNTLFIYARVDGILFGDFGGYDSFYAFIDADGDPSTGYRAMGSGAEYLVEAYGGNATVASASFQEFVGTDALNWSGWTRVSGARIAVSASSVEAAVGVAGLDFGSATAVRFLLQDHEGGASSSVPAVGLEHGALLVRREAVQPVVTATPATPLLRLTLKAVGGPVTVTDLGVAVSDNLGAPALPGLPMDLEPGVPRIVDVAVDASGAVSGGLVTADLSLVAADRPATILGTRARAYVDIPPPAKTVDGVFLDWLGETTSDPAGDAPRSGLDLVDTGAALEATEALFYARTAGPLLGGSPAPVTRAPAKAPAAPGAPPPVIRVERRSGEDVFQVYLDTNASDATGTWVDGLRADYLLSVTGYGGAIRTRELYAWQGDWVRVPATLAAANGEREVEVGVALADLPPLDDPQALIVTSDWAQPRDQGDVAQGMRGGRGHVKDAGDGTRGGDPPSPRHGDDTLEDVPALGSAPTVDGSCEAVYFNNGKFKDKTNYTFWYGEDGGFLYVCIYVGADTTDDAGDFAEIMFDTDHDGGGLDANDFKFNLTDGSSDITECHEGTGGTWNVRTCPTEDDGANSFGNNQSYEFKIRCDDVWDSSGAPPNCATTDTAGFGMHFYNASGGDNWWFGDSLMNSNDDPTDWANLTIPEFGLLAVPATLAVLVPVALRRRRRR